MKPKTPGDEIFHHPQVGTLRLRYEKLTVDSGDGQALLAYHAEAGTESAEKLALLAAMVAGERRDQPSRVPR